MSFAAPLTPTKSKQSTSQPQATTSASHHHNLDDINMLLYLDALKRKMDNENAINQKIDEAYKSFQKLRHEYFSLYSKYVDLVKKALTRRALNYGQEQIELSTAMKDMGNIKEKLSSGCATGYIDEQELEKFKKFLNSHEKHDNLEKLRAEMTELKTATRTIQTSIEAVEAALDSGTNQGLDLFAYELDMDNFPKLAQMNDMEN
ncbi:dim gamma-tubulin 4 [Haematobia irritans]|uniref:dim gamma-tubulin 4 n=1 Tax=Haematobia irritans TaxID=7368 RepID=UPI003F4FB905